MLHLVGFVSNPLPNERQTPPLSASRNSLRLSPACMLAHWGVVTSVVVARQGRTWWTADELASGVMMMIYRLFESIAFSLAS